VLAGVLEHIGERLFPRSDRSVAVVFVGGRRMRQINRRFLGHDYVTDVMSFDYGDSGGPLPERELTAEVCVCPERVCSQAERHGIDAGEELLRVMVHGLLHLAGYDDGSPRERRRMFRVQERFVAEHKDLALTLQSMIERSPEGKGLKRHA